MVINKLRAVYEKIKKETGVPLPVLECDGLDKFALFDELVASGRGQIRNGDLYIFNANTKVVFTGGEDVR